MKTKRKKKGTCSWIIVYIFLQLICLSSTFFGRNLNTLKKVGNQTFAENQLTLRSGRRCEIRFYEDSAKVVDCYLYDREERLEISSYVRDVWKKEGYKERSALSLEAEIAFHAWCYRLGIGKEQAVDADLDIHGDKRWYVYAGYSFMEVFGI